MKTVKIVIEKGKDQYAAYAENVEGIYGAGDTPEEAKEDILKAIHLLIKHNKKENIPDILKGDYKLAYRFDTESLLNFYHKVFTRSALERITGINQKLLQHYAVGLKKPRRAQAEKIQKALNSLGRELIAVEL